MMKNNMAKRPRKKDYSENEIKVITDSFVKNNEILTSKHSNDVTNRQQKDVMKEIVDQVNAVGVVMKIWVPTGRLTYLLQSNDKTIPKITATFS